MTDIFRSAHKAGGGSPGMLRNEGRSRTMERRTIEHADGRVETVETIREEDYRTSFFSAANTEQYREGARVFGELHQHVAQHDTPLHQLSTMKGEIMRELQNQLQQRQPGAVLQLPATKDRR